VKALGERVSQADTAVIAIDLANQHIQLAGGQTIGFEIEALRKQALILGLDAIGSTLQRREEIQALETRHLGANPWLV
jgi:3-isopropylmalate/(R)-2-methylmalate dehydratase small subunit